VALDVRGSPSAVGVELKAGPQGIDREFEIFALKRQ
jgi:hypothetical protein